MFVDLTTHAKEQITSILATEIVEVKQMSPGKTLVIRRDAVQGTYVKEDREWIIEQIKSCVEPLMYFPRGNEFPEPINVRELMGYDPHEESNFPGNNFYTAKEGDSI